MRPFHKRHKKSTPAGQRADICIDGFLQGCGKLRGFVQSVQFLHEVLAHGAVPHFLVAFDLVQELLIQVFLFHNRPMFSFYCARLPLDFKGSLLCACLLVSPC